MKVIEFKNKENWNNFIKKNNGSFLQSWEWGDVQKNSGKKIYRLALVDRDEIKNAILLIKNSLPLSKSYLFSPWSSYIKNDELKIFSEKIQEISKKENSFFFRYEPLTDNHEKDLAKNNFKYIGEVEPQHTLILDLEKSEEELLAQMHSKTRYNIKLAQKKGVKITTYTSDNEVGGLMFAEFWRLVSDTYERKGINAHLREYYKNIFDQPFFKLYIANFDNKIVVANLVSFFGKTATYLHGGSDKEYQKTMATALIQWQAIKDAKEQGLKFYDMYGISDKKNKWSGITRFKRGFGGEEKKYTGAWDMIFSRFWYTLYNIIKKFK